MLVVIIILIFGMLICDIFEDGCVLLIYCLYVFDLVVVLDEIKICYEVCLKEIFV